MLEILKYPNKKLREKAKEVKKNEDVRKIAEEMLETMYSAPGIGLAATQVGIPLRIIVIDITPPDQKKNPIVLLNPVILKREGETKFEEGCLSFPGVYEEVERASKVWFSGYDLNWKEVYGTAEGLLARALQHEIDHLDGILFIDRLSPFKKKLAIKRYKELHPSIQTK
jgi:peptide deformylase